MGAGVVATAGVGAWIASRPVPHPAAPAAVAPWVTVGGVGFTVDLPAEPSTPSPTAASVVTAVVGSRAYTVVPFPVAEGAEPEAALSAAIASLGLGSGSVRRGRTGPFASADVDVRLSAAWLHGRVMIVARRGYVIAELTPSPVAPGDLDRLLAGFDPHVAA